MSEFVKVMENRERLCNSYGKCGSGCPIYKETSAFDCIKWVLEHPQKAEEIIMKWANEHPAKTNADKFMEVFGKVGIDVYGLGCRGFLCNGRICAECEVKDFWNEEYKEPKGDE